MTKKYYANKQRSKSAAKPSSTQNSPQHGNSSQNSNYSHGDEHSGNNKSNSLPPVSNTSTLPKLNREKTLEESTDLAISSTSCLSSRASTGKRRQNLESDKHNINHTSSNIFSSNLKSRVVKV